MRVTLLAHTQWAPAVVPELTQRTGWKPEGSYSDGEELVEFAGRACYQSWNKPNPDTATSPGYMKNLLSQQHESVMEHANFTVYIEGVSRSLTHELVRHRHFSYSQLSQRYVAQPLDMIVVPPLFYSDPVAEAILADIQQRVAVAYEELSTHAADLLVLAGVEGVAAKKKAREAARCVLPNMTPTDIVVTGNWRAWRWFLEKRDSEAADAEIQELAVEVRRVISAEGGATALQGVGDHG